MSPRSKHRTSAPRDPAALARRDPRFAPLVKTLPRPDWRTSGSTFHALARAILYQQLAGAAAATIHRRLVRGFAARDFPIPQSLLSASETVFRTAGVSRAKERYLRDLAAHFVDGRIKARQLRHLNDNQVRQVLTQVAGIGPWTANIFLMTRLQRSDILPSDDLGIRKGVQKLHDSDAMPSPAEVAELGERWAPYRSTASWYLWRLLDF